MERNFFGKLLEWMDFKNNIMHITWIVCCFLFFLHLILYVINSFIKKRCETQVIDVHENNEFNHRLAEAIEKNRVTEVCWVLNSRPELINEPIDCKGYTPFMLACARNRAQLVKWMLSKGADVHKKTPNNDSVFYLAVFYFIDNRSEVDCPCIRELYYAGADINAPNCNGYTPLQLAAMFGHTPLVKWLLNKNANLTGTPHPYAIADSQGHRDTASAIADWVQERQAIAM
ncbi:unnamed protein product [Brassicogethes aeneus]|uniref:Ankyrin repeat domain-containing protein n=1 Tax=Brassicogethes aeneus TaxID=1431903 RepID=A0A9P0AV85_BRAAE|nr:unnamed protein product [Brassicogethes aeneus]